MRIASAKIFRASSFLPASINSCALMVLESLGDLSEPLSDLLPGLKGEDLDDDRDGVASGDLAGGVLGDFKGGASGDLADGRFRPLKIESGPPPVLGKPEPVVEPGPRMGLVVVGGLTGDFSGKTSGFRAGPVVAGLVSGFFEPRAASGHGHDRTRGDTRLRCPRVRPEARAESPVATRRLLPVAAPVSHEKS